MPKDYKFDKKQQRFVPVGEEKEEKRSRAKEETEARFTYARENQGPSTIKESDEKLYAIILWVIQFLNTALFPLVVTIVALVYFRDKSHYLYETSKSILNFQISLFIYALVGMIFAFMTFGIAGILIVPVLIGYGLIIPILGIIKSNEYTTFKPPFTITFIQ